MGVWDALFGAGATAPAQMFDMGLKTLKCDACIRQCGTYTADELRLGQHLRIDSLSMHVMILAGFLGMRCTAASATAWCRG
jgi:hypothetical protein